MLNPMCESTRMRSGYSSSPKVKSQLHVFWSIRAERKESRQLGHVTMEKHRAKMLPLHSCMSLGGRFISLWHSGPGLSLGKDLSTSWCAHWEGNKGCLCERNIPSNISGLVIHYVLLNNHLYNDTMIL